MSRGRSAPSLRYFPSRSATVALLNRRTQSFRRPRSFHYWLRGGRVDIGFLGAAQIDRYANINTTVIGDYCWPTVRLPGVGGAPEISTSAREVLIIVRQSRKSFVEKLDFVTSAGFLTGGDSREQAGSLAVDHQPLSRIYAFCGLTRSTMNSSLVFIGAYRLSRFARTLDGRLSSRLIAVRRYLRHHTNSASSGTSGRAQRPPMKCRSQWHECSLFV
jgi:Coenzyme A transferase